MKYKNRFLLSTVAIAAMVSFSVLTGCKKSNDNNAPISTNKVDIYNGPSDFTADLGTPGIPVGSEKFQSRFSKGVYNSPNHYWELTGYAPLPNRDTLLMFIELSSQFHLVLNQPFALADSTAVLEYYDLQFNIDYYTGSLGIPPGHGTMTITTMDTVAHKIAGVFSAVTTNMSGRSVPDSLVITNGKFSTTYSIKE